MKTSIKEIIKNNSVEFSRYRKGNLYYMIIVKSEDSHSLGFTYEFPVPIDDCGDGEFPSSDKAIMFMRYIRKAIDEGTFVKV